MTVNTEFITSARVLIPLAITFVAPGLIWFFRNNINRREAVSIWAGILTFISVAALVPDVLNGTIVKFTLFTLFPGVNVSFAADGLAFVFALIASFLWVFATSYNIGYMRTLNEHAQTRYYFCFAVAIFGAIGVAFSANIFTLYLFYEVISVFTYPLVAHHQDDSAFSGARKYMVYLMGTSKLFLLPAMVLTYVLAGTLDFHLGDVAQGIFPADADPTLVTITYVLYIAGLAKAALMPLHNWLPSAMVAPTPVSALLHAVAVVKAGVFSVSRVILSGFGVDLMDKLGLGLPTAYLAAFTIVTASLIALTKDDIKARLAYSTVSQLSYIIIGVAMLTPEAVQGGLMHIAHHAFSKITLFFGAGAIYVATHLKKISLMDGLGRRMPWTFGAFAIASLSMIGVPPVCGFATKWYLAKGAVTIGEWGLLIALLASTLLNAGYFAPIIYRAFFKAPAEGANIEQYSEAPLTMVIPLCTTALISVWLGLYPQTFLNFINVFGKF
ncbi:monovalent cation/H+ antiporter subunit D family protein [Maridesulfovibrio hydrothermalis]|uniref:NADH/Ubiquinone/plastoquinone (Complex I) n=1 Tax=Maridesulfovibrio hydrothermalis AM13 = DSM 14728 TaxID=1121451 RepID=L0RE29_9BACT|nr:monovalent cation/H+ antiporter subunit D family protein [Maridesulfovibrio hydrothermalis]CCO25048.1 NADH/Ubiquinone/plastoquinone (Complex I) [Maridesulfovibrio hydrothermalis AM13 = DSM 14728]